MEKEFVPYEESLELTELGFNEPCLGWFKNRKFTASFNDLYMNPHERGKKLEIIKAPLFSQAFRFFREKSYDVNVQKESEGVYFGFYWSGVAWVIVGEGTYEEAELSCLRKLIEMVKGGNK